MAICTVSASKEEWSIDMALYIDSVFLNDIMNVAQTVTLTRFSGVNERGNSLD
jgi:hypothetical protein